MLGDMERRPIDANGQEVTLRWARHPRCVGLARAQLRKALADWGLMSIEDAALVVLSELLTNAVVHAHVSPGREIETSFHQVAGGVRIAVDDADAKRPKPGPARVDGGRGLVLVAGLADRWGVDDRNGVGKSVWAVVTTPVEGQWV